MEHTDLLVIIFIFLFVVWAFGFISDIHYSECSMPDLSAYSGDCPTICECNSSLNICKVPVCEHINCKLQWYGICLGTELK
jgi:hypothetical protein